MSGQTINEMKCRQCGYTHPVGTKCQPESSLAAPTGSAKWLVWSNEHRAYWRPNMAGYTTHAKAAGRYSEEDAIRICRDARSHGDDGTPPPETMIREDCVLQNNRGQQ